MAGENPILSVSFSLWLHVSVERGGGLISLKTTRHACINIQGEEGTVIFVPAVTGAYLGAISSLEGKFCWNCSVGKG